MKRPVTARCLIGVAMVFSLLPLGTPAEGAQEPDAPSLELSTDIQPPGGVALISLSLQASDDLKVSKAVSEVAFPAKVLSLADVRRGLSAEAVDAQVTTEPIEGEVETTVVRITVTAKAGVPLVAGTLAELKFDVAEGIAEELTVALVHKASAWSEADPPVPIAAMTGKNGEVTVSALAPAIACFFYMH